MPKAPEGGKSIPLMIIDGNRNGRLVFFTHKRHIEECGGEASCAKCHHLNMPFDENTSCYECHRDMYERTDIFDHAFHVIHLGGNSGCGECHADSAQPKTAQTAKACIECHEDMLSGVAFLGKEQKTIAGIAASYKGAMHHLCIGCHRRTIQEKPDKFSAAFARCDACHGNAGDLDLHRLGPYLRDGHPGASGLAQTVALSKGRRSSGEDRVEQGRP
jgi:hypothetical protein